MTTEIEKTEQLIQSAQELKEKFQKDPHRPAYHFTPPWAWMNDINGAPLLERQIPHFLPT